MKSILPLLLLAGCFAQSGRTASGLTVSLEPERPRTDDDIAVVFDHDAQGYQIRWTKNGVPMPEWDGLETVPSALTTGGDQLIVSVQAIWAPGLGDRTTAWVEVDNTPPQVGRVTLSPESPGTDDALVASASAVDADDDPVRIRWEWFVEDERMATQTDTLASHWFAKGDVVRVRATAFDSEMGTQQSREVTIGNTRPEVSTLRITPANPTELDVLQCVADGVRDADGDSVTLNHRWEVRSNDQTVSVSSPTLDGVNFDKGDVVRCQITSEDGQHLGTRLDSEPVTIGNTPATLASVVIGPAFPRESDLISATVSGWTDPDVGDGQQLLYEWRVNGQRVASTPTLDGASFNAGDAVTVAVTPFDGEAGAPVTSNTVFAANTPPSLAQAVITPNPALSTDSLTAIPSGWTDPDPGDLPSYSYSWIVDGTVVGSGASLSSTWFSSGQSVYATVTPFDGTDRGAPVQTPTVVIGNTVPTPVVELNPVAPEAGDALTCGTVGDAIDIDGDALVYDFVWQVDGQASAYTLTGGSHLDTVAVPAGVTVDGEQWTCTVTIDDGIATRSATQSVVVGACGSLSFAGGDDHVRVANSPEFDNLSGLTLSVRAWADSLGGSQSLLAKRNGVTNNTDRVFSIGRNSVSGLMGVRVDANGGNFCRAEALAPMPLGTWQHLIGTYNGTQLDFWVDGVLQAAVPCALSLATYTGTENTLQIGQLSQNNNTWHGHIDDVQIYDRALSDPEIATLFQGGHPASASLIGAWAFDEGSGTTASDQTGNHDGVVTGATWAQVCDTCDPQTIYEDGDGDGFGSGLALLTACDAGPGYATNGDDCHDQDATTYPNAPAVCDGGDHGCDGIPDDQQALGQTASCAAASCDDILLNDPNAADGFEWLDPTGVDPFVGWCDQTIDGGGWLVLFKNSGGQMGSTASNQTLFAQALAGQTGTPPAPHGPTSGSEINGPAFRAHWDATDLEFRRVVTLYGPSLGTEREEDVVVHMNGNTLQDVFTQDTSSGPPGCAPMSDVFDVRTIDGVSFGSTDVVLARNYNGSIGFGLAFDDPNLVYDCGEPPSNLLSVPTGTLQLWDGAAASKMDTLFSYVHNSELYSLRGSERCWYACWDGTNQGGRSSASTWYVR